MLSVLDESNNVLYVLRIFNHKLTPLVDILKGQPTVLLRGGIQQSSEKGSITHGFNKLVQRYSSLVCF